MGSLGPKKQLKFQMMTYVIQGQFHIENRNSQQAIECFVKAAELDPFNDIFRLRISDASKRQEGNNVISMNGKAVNDAVCQNLSAHLMENAAFFKLQILDLSNNSISSVGMHALVLALSSYRSVTRLHLSKNRLGDDGAEKISELFMHPNSRLNFVEIASNDIGPKGASMIAAGLLKNRFLTELDISDNLIQNIGVSAIALALQWNQNLPLTTVRMLGSDPGDQAVKHLTKALEMRPAIKVELGKRPDKINVKVWDEFMSRGVVVNTKSFKRKLITRPSITASLKVMEPIADKIESWSKLGTGMDDTIWNPVLNRIHSESAKETLEKALELLTNTTHYQHMNGDTLSVRERQINEDGTSTTVYIPSREPMPNDTYTVHFLSQLGSCAPDDINIDIGLGETCREIVTLLVAYQTDRSWEVANWLNVGSTATQWKNVYNDHFNLICEEMKMWVRNHLARYPLDDDSLQRIKERMEYIKRLSTLVQSQSNTLVQSQSDPKACPHFNGLLQNVLRQLQRNAFLREYAPFGQQFAKMLQDCNAGALRVSEFSLLFLTTVYRNIKHYRELIKSGVLQLEAHATGDNAAAAIFKTTSGNLLKIVLRAAQGAQADFQKKEDDPEKKQFENPFFVEGSTPCLPEEVADVAPHLSADNGHKKGTSVAFGMFGDTLQSRSDLSSVDGVVDATQELEPFAIAENLFPDIIDEEEDSGGDDPLENAPEIDDFEGWMHKKGEQKFQGFQKRWFVMKQDKIKYFKTKEASEAKGFIPLDSATVAKKAGKCDFTVGQPGPGERQYYLRCDKPSTVEEWMLHISERIEILKEAPSICRTIDPSTKGGYLWKAGKVNKDFKKRYFSFEADKLCYYKNKKMKAKAGDIPLTKSAVVEQMEGGEREFMLFVQPYEGARKYMLAANSQADAEAWVKAISQVSAKSQIEAGAPKTFLPTGGGKPAEPLGPCCFPKLRGNEVAVGISREFQADEFLVPFLSMHGYIMYFLYGLNLTLSTTDLREKTLAATFDNNELILLVLHNLLVIMEALSEELEKLTSTQARLATEKLRVSKPNSAKFVGLVAFCLGKHLENFSQMMRRYDKEVVAKRIQQLQANAKAKAPLSQKLTLEPRKQARELKKNQTDVPHALDAELSRLSQENLEFFQSANDFVLELSNVLSRDLDLMEIPDSVRNLGKKLRQQKKEKRASQEEQVQGWAIQNLIKPLPEYEETEDEIIPEPKRTASPAIVEGGRKEGYLLKTGKEGLQKAFQRRYFSLKDKSLQYFKEEGGKAKGEIPLTKDSVCDMLDLHSLLSTTINEPHRNVFYVASSHTARNYFLSSGTDDEEAVAWIKAIRERVARLKGGSGGLQGLDRGEASSAVAQKSILGGRHVILELNMQGKGTVDKKFKAEGDAFVAAKNGEEAAKYYVHAIEINPNDSSYAQALSEAAKMSMQQLLLNGKALGENDVDWIISQMQDNCKDLDLANNQIGPEGCERLCKTLSNSCPNLESLSFSKNAIRAGGGQFLSKAIRIHKHLQAVDLSGCKLTSAEAKYLAIALESNTSLKKINLSSNELGDEGIKEIAEALQINVLGCLETLQIASISMTDIGGQNVCDLVISVTFLRRVDFDGNNLTAGMKENLTQKLTEKRSKYGMLNAEEQARLQQCEASICDEGIEEYCTRSFALLTGEAQADRVEIFGRIRSFPIKARQVLLEVEDSDDLVGALEKLIKVAQFACDVDDEKDIVKKTPLCEKIETDLALWATSLKRSASWMLTRALENMQDVLYFASNEPAVIAKTLRFFEADDKDSISSTSSDTTELHTVYKALISRDWLRFLTTPTQSIQDVVTENWVQEVTKMFEEVTVDTAGVASAPAAEEESDINDFLSGDAQKEKKKKKKKALGDCIEGVKGLMDELHFVKDTVVDLVPTSWNVFEFFVKQFHKHYTAIYRDQTYGGEVVTTNVVASLRFVQWYKHQLEELLQESDAFRVEINQELEQDQAVLCDQYFSQTRSIVETWVSNTLKQELKSEPSPDEEGFLITESPIDLFNNINRFVSTITDIVKLDNQGKMRVGMICVQVLNSYGTSLNKFLADGVTFVKRSLEKGPAVVQEKEDKKPGVIGKEKWKKLLKKDKGGGAGDAKDVVESAGVAERLGDELINLDYLYAQINNSGTYTEQLSNLEEELTETMDDEELKDALQTPFSDCEEPFLSAADTCTYLIVLVLNSFKLQDNWDSLFSEQWFQNPSAWSDVFTEALTASCQEFSKRVKREAFLGQYVKKLMPEVVGEFLRAIVTKEVSTQVNGAADRIGQIKESTVALVGFFEDFSEIVPEMVIKDHLDILKEHVPGVMEADLEFVSLHFGEIKKRVDLVDGLSPAKVVEELLKCRADCPLKRRKELVTEFTMFCACSQ